MFMETKIIMMHQTCFHLLALSKQRALKGQLGSTKWKKHKTEAEKMQIQNMKKRPFNKTVNIFFGNDDLLAAKMSQ